MSHGRRAQGMWHPSRRSSLTVGVAAQLDSPHLETCKFLFPKESLAESKIYPQRAPGGGSVDSRWITPCALPLLAAHFTCTAYSPPPVGQVLAVLAPPVPGPPKRRVRATCIRVPIQILLQGARRGRLRTVGKLFERAQAISKASRETGVARLAHNSAAWSFLRKLFVRDLLPFLLGDATEPALAATRHARLSESVSASHQARIECTRASSDEPAAM